ncbi:uncharacterized protein [Choristoneura fumiferana]|uniref:uncharacterized protein n=1 Tax=Choristoneura fumiferana TaxID=7141 RepID=UPI003D15AB6A
MSLTNSRPDNSTRIHSKFTRGEKCIFAHLIVTFVLLIVLLIIYFIHLWLVKHNGNQAYATYLRSSDINPEDIRPEYHPVGLVYADTNTFMCNCLLIRYRWSLAPGHCVAARSDPDLADVLPRWRIKYRTRSDSIAANFSETAIKRSIAHPHFNNDDFSNNIGLFQHDVSIPIFSYMFPNQFQLSASSLKTFKDDLELIGWEESWQPPDGHILETSVRPVTLEKCTRYVSPIVDLRNYEYCVKPAVRRNATIVPGAVLSMNSKLMGLFSWGDTSGSATPFIIIDIVNFKDWIEHVVAI